ncbi:MAG: AAA family ATPase [Melioribacteraceae bacterium]|nr:AAA family ATPase [Melioribacteraceae bacterium]
MTRIISIANQKGGVGKTTTAINLASLLAAAEKKTLLIDIDPQSNSSSGLSIVEHNPSIYEVLIGKEDIKNVIIESYMPYLDLLPSNINLVGAEIEMVELQSRETILKNSLSEVYQRYEYIIIDCPPSLVGMTESVLHIADSVLVPVKSSMFSIVPIAKLFDRIEVLSNNGNPDLHVEGIFLTMHEVNTKASFSAKKELFNLYPNEMLTTSIPKNIAAEEASFRKDPVIIVEPRAKSSIAYIQLADEIIEKNSSINDDLFQSFSDTESLYDL